MKIERLKLFVLSIVCATIIGLLCKSYIITVNAHTDGTIGNAITEIGSTVKYIYNHIDWNNEWANTKYEDKTK